jgi:hypothetical protein
MSIGLLPIINMNLIFFIFKHKLGAGKAAKNILIDTLADIASHWRTEPT